MYYGIPEFTAFRGTVFTVVTLICLVMVGWKGKDVAKE